MGIFTYRQTKKTKHEVKRLRADQRLLAQAQMTHQAALAQNARETELFQALPPEGKAEFRAIKAAYDQKSSTWSPFKQGWGGKEVREAKRALADGKKAVLRKYDLIP
jgi:hypothetical protein